MAWPLVSSRSPFDPMSLLVSMPKVNISPLVACVCSNYITRTMPNAVLPCARLDRASDMGNNGVSLKTEHI